MLQLRAVNLTTVTSNPTFAGLIRDNNGGGERLTPPPQRSTWVHAHDVGQLSSDLDLSDRVHLIWLLQKMRLKREILLRLLSPMRSTANFSSSGRRGEAIEGRSSWCQCRRCRPPATAGAATSHTKDPLFPTLLLPITTNDALRVISYPCLDVWPESVAGRVHATHVQ